MTSWIDYQLWESTRQKMYLIPNILLSCSLLDYFPMSAVFREHRLTLTLDKATIIRKTSGNNKITHCKAKEGRFGDFHIMPTRWARVIKGWLWVPFVPLGEGHSGLRADLFKAHPRKWATLLPVLAKVMASWKQTGGRDWPLGLRRWWKVEEGLPAPRIQTGVQHACEGHHGLLCLWAEAWLL